MNRIDIERLFMGITNISEDILEEAENFRPKKENVLWLHRLAKTAGGVAAALAVITAALFSINAFFPAFAEELPLIGHLFRMYNREHKVSVGTYVGTYSGVSQIDSEALGTNGELLLTAKEAYSDGRYVHLSFTLETPEEYRSAYSWICTEMEVTVNGVSTETNGFALWPAGDRFSGTTAVKLEDSVDNGETLEVKYAIGEITGITGDGIGQEDIPGTFSGNLSVIADTANNRMVSGFTGGGEIWVESVETTPSYTKISCTIPFWGMAGGLTAYPRLFTDDGTPIRRTVTESVLPEESSVDREAETIDATFFFDGLPKGTKTVILRFLEADVDENMVFVCSGEERKAGVLGEVTIDLTSKKVASSSTYQEIGWAFAEEYLDTFDSLEWHLGFDVLGKQEDPFDLPELFQNGISLESLGYGKEGKFSATFLSTERLEKDLSLTIEDDENRVIATAAVSQDQETEEGKYDFRVKADCLPAGKVQFLDHVTIKLSDPDTGETLYERRIRFVRKRYGF